MITLFRNLYPLSTSIAISTNPLVRGNTSGHVTAILISIVTGDSCPSPFNDDGSGGGGGGRGRDLSVTGEVMPTFLTSDVDVCDGLLPLG